MRPNYNANERIRILSIADADAIPLGPFQESTEWVATFESDEPDDDGNRTEVTEFATRGEAIEHARSVGSTFATVGDLAKRHGWQRYTDERYLTPTDPMEDDDITLCPSSERYGFCTATRSTTDRETWVRPDVLGGSDYSGSSVERANHKVFIDQFGKVPGVVDLSGDYGTYGIAIRCDVCDFEILETLERLQDYPVIDDDALGEVENDMDQEAYDSWVESDFRREILSRFGVDVSETPAEAIRIAFDNACNDSGTYFECDGADRHIRVDDLVRDGLDFATVRALPGAIVEPDADDIQVTAEREDREKILTTIVENTWTGGHRLTYRTDTRSKWTIRHGHPAASIAECERCKRTGWTNVRPIDGAPNHGGPIFREHCAHGKDPATHCHECGEPQAGPGGIVGPWVGSYGRSKPGETCADYRHAKPTTEG